MSIPQAIVNTQTRPNLSANSGSGRGTFVAHRSALVNGAIPDVWDPKGAIGPAFGTIPLVDAPTVRVGDLWLFQDTVNALNRASWSQSPLEIARAAVEQGVSRMGELTQGVYTQHALMVAWGEFAHEIGLIEKLSQAPIPQKSVVHTPQAKVLTFLMGILTGMTHLKDLNEGPHPLAHDWVAIRAWGLAALPHYSGVSRTLAACDEAAVAAITQVLHTISQPFIDREVRRLRAGNRPLILDLDLAPRRVSNTSTTFPDATFGWQGDQVGLGYDAALVALTSPTYGRLFLAGFHYPRNPIELPRLQKMVREAEARLGVRPRRRTERVKQRLRDLEQQMTQRQQWLDNQLDRQAKYTAQLKHLPDEIADLKVEVARLETIYQAQDRAAKPHSQLAKTRHRLASAQKKLAQGPKKLERTQRAVATHRQRLEHRRAQHTALTTYLEQLEADNAQNPEPVAIIVRMDAGFGTGPNLTWLIEMGYIIYTKAGNAQVVAKFKAMLTPDTGWTRVGKNAEMTAWGEQHVSRCPYPLTVALERFHTPQGLKHSALILYRDDDEIPALPAWFDFYNARQTIEAGIKETNVVFKRRPEPRRRDASPQAAFGGRHRAARAVHPLCGQLRALGGGVVAQAGVLQPATL